MQETETTIMWDIIRSKWFLYGAICLFVLGLFALFFYFLLKKDTSTASAIDTSPTPAPSLNPVQVQGATTGIGPVIGQQPVLKTSSPSPSIKISATPSPSPTPSPSESASASVTATPSPSATATVSPTPSLTPSPSASESPSASASSTI